MKIINYLEPSIYNSCDMDIDSGQAVTLDNQNPADLISDVQSSRDERDIAIDRVGIKDIRHPVVITDYAGRKQNTVANFSMYVSLPGSSRGTHMSRFIKILNDREHDFSVASFNNLIREVTHWLESDSVHIEMSFPYFMEKTAPVSKAKGLLDYQVSLIGKSGSDGRIDLTLKVIVPVTTLCPCARKISDYGAHNQRSHVTLHLKIEQHFWIEEIINLAESKASCELYSQLKRADEKFVTERAYDNPRFVEDLVRDIAAALNSDERVTGYSIESENFESIHNHSAYARITNPGSG